MKILFIGNSFSEDTSRYLAEIGLAAGEKEMTVANLYVGGCPIERHHLHLSEDLPAYRYSKNDGGGWQITPDFKISRAVEDEFWDVIAIQHGSKNARYTDPDCYQHLASLVQKVKSFAKKTPRIVFNMTWVGEKDYRHHELVHFDGDAFQMYRGICRITEDLVQKTPGIDQVTPTGTAVQNARNTPLASRLSRDGYHLSLDLGRYLGGMAFYYALTKKKAVVIPWAPENVTEEDKKWIVCAVNAAIEHPFQCTMQIG